VLTGVTLTVLVGLLAVGAVFGWRAMVAPAEPHHDRHNGTARAHGCDPQIKRGDVVTPRDVRVSVYNAGTRSGLAGETLSSLADRGFRRGKVGNAPRTYASVKFVRVLAPTAKDPAAKLVALQFGPHTVVVRIDRNLGRGVEVVVGDGFFGLAKAPGKLRAKAPGSGC
jgi:hypothetical protein